MNMTEKKPFFGSATSKWILAGAAVLTIGVGVAVADWARGGYGHRWEGRGMGPGRSMGMQRVCEGDPLRFEGVARAFLKADLDLNAQQNAELDKLAGQLVPALKSLRDEVCNNFGQQAASVSAPERVEKFAAMLRKAADTAEKTVAPTKSFYATLDDKQKMRVEELSNRRHGMGGPGFRGPNGPGFGGPYPGGPAR
jgi:hypothetical protein